MSNSEVSSNIRINISGVIDVKYDKLLKKWVITFEQTHPDIVGKIETKLIIDKSTALSLFRKLKRVNIE